MQVEVGLKSLAPPYSPYGPHLMIIVKEIREKCDRDFEIFPTSLCIFRWSVHIAIETEETFQVIPCISQGLRDKPGISTGKLPLPAATQLRD